MSFLALFAAFYCGWLVACACGVVQRVYGRRTEAMHRRVGWGYGYGAGVVDGRNGRYDPRVPFDGRSRHPLPVGDTDA